MGYRSDVAMRIEFDTLKDLQTHFTLLSDQLKAIGEEVMLSEDCIHVHGTELTLTYYDIKWYEGNYPEVDTIMDWFNSMADAADEHRAGVKGTQYICIGEDVEDTEERCSGDLYNYMYITRSIEL